MSDPFSKLADIIPTGQGLEQAKEAGKKAGYMYYMGTGGVFLLLVVAFFSGLVYLYVTSTSKKIQTVLIKNDPACAATSSSATEYNCVGVDFQTKDGSVYTDRIINKVPIPLVKNNQIDINLEDYAIVNLTYNNPFLQYGAMIGMIITGCMIIGIVGLMAAMTYNKNIVGIVAAVDYLNRSRPR